MKATTLIILLFIALGFGAAIFYFVTFDGSGSFTINRPAPSSPSNQPASLSQNIAGKYIDYTPQALADAHGKKQVLFFYANWCPICKPLDEEIKANLNKIPDNVVIIKINYDDDQTDAEEKALAQKYGVTYQHTFVQIDGQGNEITKWNGGDLNNLLSSIQ